MCNQGGFFEYYAFDINRGTAHTHLRMGGNEQRWNLSGFLTTDSGTGLSRSDRIGRSSASVPSLVMSASERESFRLRAF